MRRRVARTAAMIAFLVASPAVFGRVADGALGTTPAVTVLGVVVGTTAATCVLTRRVLRRYAALAPDPPEEVDSR